MVEDLYNQRIKVAEAEEKKYRGIVKYFVEDVIVDQMMKTSPDMADLYRETYWGRSFYDGLKVPSYNFNSRQGKIFSRLDPPSKSLISTFSSNGRLPYPQAGSGEEKLRPDSGDELRLINQRVEGRLH